MLDVMSRSADGVFPPILFRNIDLEKPLLDNNDLSVI